MRNLGSVKRNESQRFMGVNALVKVSFLRNKYKKLLHQASNKTMMKSSKQKHCLYLHNNLYTLLIESFIYYFRTTALINPYTRLAAASERCVCTLLNGINEWTHTSNSDLYYDDECSQNKQKLCVIEEKVLLWMKLLSQKFAICFESEQHSTAITLVSTLSVQNWNYKLLRPRMKCSF